MDTKECRRCGKEKAAEEFYLRKNSSDGLHSYCRDCIDKQSREWRRQNKVRARAVDRAAKRGGGPRPAPLLGEAHGGWKGDDVTYSGAHSRVRKVRGPASGYDCAECGCEALDWSYLGGCPREKEGEDHGVLMVYSPDVLMYRPLCRACHLAVDRIGP